jgi:hypothetical protein
VRLLITVILRFIQPHMPLLPLEPMGQLRHGVTQILAVHHPLVVVIPRFIQPREPLLPLKLKGVVVGVI